MEIKIQEGDKVNFLCAGVASVGKVIEYGEDESRVSCGSSVVAVNTSDLTPYEEATEEVAEEAPVEKSTRGRKKK